jgi:hypothetical protein
MALGLRAKLLAGFITVSLIAVGVGVASMVGFRQTLARTEAQAREAEQFALATREAKEAQVSFKTQVQEWKNLLLRGNDPALLEKYKKAFVAEGAETQKSLAALGAVLARENVSLPLVAETVKAHEDLCTKYLAAAATYAPADRESAFKVDKLVKGIDRAATENIDKVVTEINRIRDERKAATSVEVARAARRTEVWSVAGLAAGAVVAVGLGVWLSTAIGRTLGRVTGQLAAGARETTSAARQVSQSSQTLAQSASQQAANLEEAGSALEEMSSMTRRNAESTKHAAGLTDEAKAAADAGNVAMAKMSDAIRQIESSAGETAKVLKVIDEIAFQTNLLALNAAVEAARAGEAGKGFAVVAEEVRNLAIRSAEAARNTTGMIEQSVNSARQGVALAAEVAAGLAKIGELTTGAQSVVSEIAASTQEQSQGIAQVNGTVGSLDKLTQQGAAQAEEAASASEELSGQAEQLNGVVGELEALLHGRARAA